MAELLQSMEKSGNLLSLANLQIFFGREAMEITEEERRPFEAIAARKSKSISWDASALTETDTGPFHLDMDMIDASIDDAIMRLETAEGSSVLDKLKRFRKTATDAEKISFVMGSGTFWFPEDLTLIAESSRVSDQPVPFAKKCELVCYVLCRCVFEDPPEMPPGGAHQVCSDICRKVCSVIND